MLIFKAYICRSSPKQVVRGLKSRGTYDRKFRNCSSKIEKVIDTQNTQQVLREAGWFTDGVKISFRVNPVYRFTDGD